MSPHVWDGITVVPITALRGRRYHAAETAYLMHWVMHPDPGSVFEQRSKWIRRLFFSWAPERAIIRFLTALRYNGFLFVENGAVVGHVFYQQHKDALHMFSVSVRKELEGQGRATEQLKYFVHAAHDMPEITRVRLGAGGHGAVRRMVEKMERCEVTFPFSICMEEDGWVHFAGKL